MISVLKHCPGHGSTTSDSHEGLPIVRKSLTDLRRRAWGARHCFARSGLRLCNLRQLRFGTEKNYCGKNDRISRFQRDRKIKYRREFNKFKKINLTSTIFN
ncbi:MAG: hypothetical protein LBQ03_01010 [Puniceicoccales bacterium]|nr:hypothetical protein [Puniceicoccales bacterium]